MAAHDHNDPLAPIRAMLAQDPELKDPAIKVSLTHNVITLEGEVADIITKRRTLHQAREVAHTTEIIDRLRLKATVHPSPAELQHAAIEALRQEAVFAGMRVSDESHPEDSYWICVSAQDLGVLKLAGQVGSLTHRRLAEVIAWWVPGCRDVDNRLHVFPPEQDNDPEITDAVRMVLEKEPGLDAEEITIHTHNREVTLSGVVHSDELKTRAILDCWYIPGVHAVRDQLKVRPR